MRHTAFDIGDKVKYENSTDMYEVVDETRDREFNTTYVILNVETEDEITVYPESLEDWDEYIRTERN